MSRTRSRSLGSGAAFFTGTTRGLNGTATARFGAPATSRTGSDAATKRGGGSLPPVFGGPNLSSASRLVSQSREAVPLNNY